MYRPIGCSTAVTVIITTAIIVTTSFHCSSYHFLTSAPLWAKQTQLSIYPHLLLVCILNLNLQTCWAGCLRRRYVAPLLYDALYQEMRLASRKSLVSRGDVVTFCRVINHSVEDMCIDTRQHHSSVITCTPTTLLLQQNLNVQVRCSLHFKVQTLDCRRISFD